MYQEPREIIHDDPCIDLLPDKVTADAVKTGKGEGILQEPERCFDTPAHTVQLFQERKAEGVCRKVREEIGVRSEELRYALRA